jgi:hypothetical protein
VEQALGVGKCVGGGGRSTGNDWRLARCGQVERCRSADIVGTLGDSGDAVGIVRTQGWWERWVFTSTCGWEIYHKRVLRYAWVGRG